MHFGMILEVLKKRMLDKETGKTSSLAVFTQNVSFCANVDAFRLVQHQLILDARVDADVWCEWCK